MAVFADSTMGTIGGGHLEFEAIHEARARLQGKRGEDVLRYALGPALGQCCGGAVQLRYESLNANDLEGLPKRLSGPTSDVAVFGGGHVGKALVEVLGTLPFLVTWIDSRDEIFPTDVASSVTCDHSEPVQGAVADLRPGARIVIMSFSHAEDLEIVASILKRRREGVQFPYVGLIGSKTKWATFRSRLTQRGFTDDELAHVTCPVGVQGIHGKEPAVIAVSVAAQLLQESAGHSVERT
jgi:xanthine dehydrogenase accessory factor